MRLSPAWCPAALLLLSMSGCGAGGPQSCKITVTVDVPLLDHARMPIVVGRLDDHQVGLLLDTGAAQSIVLPSAVDRFKLASASDRFTWITGIGGTALTHFASIHSLELGHGHVRNLDLPITGMTNISNRSQLPMLGMFGADFMSNYDVDIDLPRHHFGMYKLADCGMIQPVETPYFTMPFHLEGTAIKVELKLNGVPVDAQLDSGAATTMVTEDDARHAGVTQDMLAADRSIGLTGVDGSPVQGGWHRFASLEIGNERLNNFRLAVAPSAVDITLLGDDFLRYNRVWISYPLQTLFIQPAAGNPIVHVATAQAP